MEACEGFIVINGMGAAAIGAAGAALMALIGKLVLMVVEGRDNHIKYTVGVNADLTETNKILSGTARGAVDTVRRQRTTG